MKIPQKLTILLVALLFAGCSNSAPPPAQSAASPTDALRTFIEASKKKDIETVKKTLSKGSLALVEKTAQTQNATVDEMLQRGNADLLDDAPEISNEKIENETATVDVKVKDSSSDTIPFVKEDGVWKIAFDKYQEMMLEKMRQEMKLPEPSVSKPEGNRKSNAPANQPAANK